MIEQLKSQKQWVSTICTQISKIQLNLSAVLAIINDLILPILVCALRLGAFAGTTLPWLIKWVVVLSVLGPKTKYENCHSALQRHLTLWHFSTP